MSRNVELESAIKYTISNPTRYNGFLRVAANNFRLSTANQLFVYYQKEDADIVLDAGRWEKLFGRIVADNAQKIRIVQTGKTGKPQWTTYYDIADTIVTDDSKPVMRATVAQDVSMEQIREIAEKKMLLASSQIEDYMAANGIIAPAERIIGFIKDSIISEVAIKCGQEPLLYYEQINDFRKWALKDERIFKVFSAFFHNISNEMVNELSATQQRENDIETERTGGNRSDNTRGIEGEGSSAGTDGERRRGIAGINHRTEIISGKVREAEAGILGESEPSTNNDLGRVPVGADSISESSSAASVTNEAADDETAHHEKGDNGGIETSESDVVGSKNDNGAERSGGSNSPRSDLHRIEQTIELADYSDEEQDELLNQVLCASKDLKYKIYFTYERQLRDEKMSAADFAKFIANAYGTGGAYPFTKYKGQDINLAYDLSKGLQLRAGFKDKGLSYTWRVVGRRIRHLIEDNRYLTEDEKTGYLEYIHNEEIRTRRAAIGKDLLSLVRKYNEETENKETWVNTYELTFVLNAYEGREISFGSKSVRKSLDSVLDTITNFGGEKYLPAVDGIKNRLIIEDNAEKQEKKNRIYSAADLAEPKVTILWSESEELQDGQVMSLYEANSTFERLDGERHEAQGYDKTKFKINYVLDGEVGSYEGRYDIGDGDGSLIDHISTYQTDFLDNEKWDAYIKERDGEEALAADKKQRKQLVYKFIPYLNLHVALSEIEAQANKRLERSANLSDGINSSMPIPPEYEYIPSTKYEKQITMYSICNSFSVMATASMGGDKTALDAYFDARPNGDRAKLKYSAARVSGDKTKGSIFSTMITDLTIFTYENYAKMTAENDLNLLDIGFGDKPYAIFISTPDYDNSSFFIASVFIRQLYYVLAQYCTIHTNDGKCKREVVFLLDEFGNLPPIENFSNILTVCLGRNIRFNLVVQSNAQVERRYDKDAETIIGNCGNQYFLSSGDLQTVKHFSEQLGSETFKNVSRSGEKMSLNKSFTENYEEKPLLNPNELQGLAPGENVIVRIMTRNDLRGNSIDHTSVYNVGNQRFKYRYEYLTKSFPNLDKIDLDKITWGDTSKVNLDLHVYDIDAHFAKLAEKMEAEKNSKEKASGRTPGAGERNKAKMDEAV